MTNISRGLSRWLSMSVQSCGRISKPNSRNYSPDAMSAALVRCMFGAAVLAMSSAAHAATPAEFYKGRTMPVIIGYSAGGGYDLYARVLAQHMGRHIPG